MGSQRKKSDERTVSILPSLTPVARKTDCNVRTYSAASSGERMSGSVTISSSPVPALDKSIWEVRERALSVDFAVSYGKPESRPGLHTGRE